MSQKSWPDLSGWNSNEFLGTPGDSYRIIQISYIIPEESCRISSQSANYLARIFKIDCMKHIWPELSSQIMVSKCEERVNISQPDMLKIM